MGSGQLVHACLAGVLVVHDQRQVFFKKLIAIDAPAHLKRFPVLRFLDEPDRGFKESLARARSRTLLFLVGKRFQVSAQIVEHYGCAKAPLNRLPLAGVFENLGQDIGDGSLG